MYVPEISKPFQHVPSLMTGKAHASTNSNGSWESGQDVWDEGQGPTEGVSDGVSDQDVGSDAGACGRARKNKDWLRHHPVAFPQKSNGYANL